MVPASLFRYGSIFTEVRRSPADFSKTPMLDAVIPLPSPDRTPPVTTTYFMQSTGFEADMSRISTLALWITKLLAKVPVSQV